MCIVRVCYWLGLFFHTHVELLRALPVKSTEAIHGYLLAMRAARMAR